MLITVLIMIVVLVIVVPLVVPLPARRNLNTIEELKDADSQFIQLNGLNIHYKQAGSGPAIVLLHGFGAYTFTWREVMAPLAGLGNVISYDRPGFGLTERPMPGSWSGDSPYSLDSQAQLLIAMLDAKGIQRAVLVGNSAGGTVAVYTALKYPDRVQALVLVDASIYASGLLPQWLKPVLASPQGRWFGPLFTRTLKEGGVNMLPAAWHDPAKLSDAVKDGYRKPLRTANADRALWELMVAQQPSHLPQRLAELKMPVLVVTGDDDRTVPTDLSLRLAREIPGARLALIQFCGHLPQEERPVEFMNAVGAFLQTLK